MKVGVDAVTKDVLETVEGSPFILLSTSKKTLCRPNLIDSVKNAEVSPGGQKGDWLLLDCSNGYSTTCHRPWFIFNRRVP